MKNHILSFAIVLALSVPAATAQTVVKHSNADQALVQRVDWAHKEPQQRRWRQYWIGYSIDRMMDENSHIGHFSSDWREEVSLHELLTGEKPPEASSRESVRDAARRVLEEMEDQSTRRKVLKKLAILVRFESGRSGVEDVKFSNMTLPVDLEDIPLIWLGSADDDESIRYLEELFEESKGQEVREDLVSAVGIHDEKERTFSFLRDVLNGRDDDDVREQAAFWLGQRDTHAALDLLVRTAETDRSEDVREQAVFGISQLEIDQATETLIDLAQNSRSSTVREQAKFRLGQAASKKAVAAIESSDFDDEQTRIQKQAVFALTQVDDADGVPFLIKLAKTHKNPAVRKQAIFWLSQSDDLRALEALIEFVRGD